MFEERVHRVQRYFVDQGASDGRFFITGDDYYHIVKVMRMHIGESIICVAPEGNSAVCRLAEITDERVVADVVQWKEEISRRK